MATMNRYLDWAKTVICWDGILPVVISQVGIVANWLSPKDSTNSTLIALVFIIGAFFLRCWIGHVFYRDRPYPMWQGALFMIAIFLLLFLDALLIVFSMHPDAMRADDWEQWAVMYAVYLSMMALATFPFYGRNSS